MEIHLWKNWIDSNESRITPIDSDEYRRVWEHHCLPDTSRYLLKHIYNPTFDIGVFHKQGKTLPSYEQGMVGEVGSARLLPNRHESLVCSTSQISDTDSTYVVYPFKNAQFALVREGTMNRAYWKSKVSWLDAHDISELWTDSSCLLIRMDTWKKLLNK
jgi:hypothetical protein